MEPLMPPKRRCDHCGADLPADLTQAMVVRKQSSVLGVYCSDREECQEAGMAKASDLDG